MTEPVHIDVYSDVVCPWCYVGKRRLERALGSGGVSAQVAWRPFQLNPTMPKDGMDRRTYLEAKFGSLDAFRHLEEQVSAAGVSVGISFAFDQIARTANTFLAHRLIWLAERESCQDAVVESLFRGYFEEGADIGAISVLAALADRAGLPQARVETFLHGDEGTPEVKMEEAAGHQMGIRSVPYFVFNGTYGLSGAQPVETFRAAFAQAMAGPTQPRR